MSMKLTREVGELKEGLEALAKKVEALGGGGKVMTELRGEVKELQEKFKSFAEGKAAKAEKPAAEDPNKADEPAAKPARKSSRKKASAKR